MSARQLCCAHRKQDKNDLFFLSNEIFLSSESIDSYHYLFSILDEEALTMISINEKNSNHATPDNSRIFNFIDSF